MTGARGPAPSAVGVPPGPVTCTRFTSGKRDPFAWVLLPLSATLKQQAKGGKIAGL